MSDEDEHQTQPPQTTRRTRRVRRRRKLDRDRLTWPFARTDWAAFIAAGAMITLFALGHPELGLVALLIAAIMFMWPTSEEIEVTANPQDGSVAMRAKRDVGADVVETVSEEETEPASNEPQSEPSS